VRLRCSERPVIGPSSLVFGGWSAWGRRLSELKAPGRWPAERAIAICIPDVNIQDACVGALAIDHHVGVCRAEPVGDGSRDVIDGGARINLIKRGKRGVVEGAVPPWDGVDVAAHATFHSEGSPRAPV
jgi:hypothetical protein